MASSYKPTAKGYETAGLPAAPWAVSSSFEPTSHKGERRKPGAEIVVFDMPPGQSQPTSQLPASKPASPSPPPAAADEASSVKLDTSAQAAQRPNFGVGVKRPISMDGTADRCQAPINDAALCAAFADFERLSSQGMLNMNMRLPPMPQYVPPQFGDIGGYLNVDTSRDSLQAREGGPCEVSPREDSTQLGSACPSPSNVSSHDNASDGLYEEGHLDELHLDDLSGLMGVAPGDSMDMSLTDELLPRTITNADLDFSGSPARAARSTRPSTTSLASSVLAPPLSAHPSSSSMATLPFERGDSADLSSDLFDDLEGLCDPSELRKSRPDHAPRMLSMEPRSRRASSEAPHPTPGQPIEQLDIARMLATQADDADLFLHLSHECGFFNMDTMLSAPSSAPPVGSDKLAAPKPKKDAKPIRTPSRDPAIPKQLQMMDSSAAPAPAPAPAAPPLAAPAPPAAGAGAPSAAPGLAPVAMLPRPSSSVQLSTPYVPPALMSQAQSGMKRNPSFNLQHAAMNHVTMAAMSQMQPGGANQQAAMSQTQTMKSFDGSKKKSKGFSWQSLKVFPASGSKFS